MTESIQDLPRPLDLEAYRRSYYLLGRKYLQYLVPAMVTMAAASLNEFVDSMVVSRLLGDEALAIVNLGAPLMMTYAAIYELFGVGGSMNYAIALGRRDHTEAGRSLVVSVGAALACGLAVMVLGLLFPAPLSRLLCSEPTLHASLASYVRVLLISAPFLTTTMALTHFLTPAGHPFLETVVSVSANVINIVMDYVYIRVLGLGVSGAAWATLTGYLVAAGILVVLVLRKKLHIYTEAHVTRPMATLATIVRGGSPDALTQVGFSLQIACCNALAAAYAGKSGIVAFSVCQQTTSMISIFTGAIIGVSIPLISVLHGQRDFGAARWTLRSSVILQECVGIVGCVAFVLFAPHIAAMYNVSEASQLALTIHALRVFSLMFLFRCFNILFFRYLKVLGMSGYAVLVSALDGFAGIIPIAWLSCLLLGINGLWTAFPATSCLITLMVLCVNRRVAVASEGRLSPLLLGERETSSALVMDVSITSDSSQIAGISGSLMAICEAHGMSRTKAMHAALAVEELAIYASNKKDQSSFMDFLVHLDGDEVVIDFRSIGSPCNPLVDMGQDVPENVRLLRGVADRIEFETIMGMNSVRIILTGDKAEQ